MLTSLNNIVVSDPADLLQPKQMMSFPIDEIATALYPMIKDYIDEDEVGIYVGSSLKPIVLPEQVLYLKNGQHVTWFDLPSIEEDIFNKHGNLVLSANMLRNKEKFLSLTPTISLTALKIIRQYIETTISTYCQWASTTHNGTRLSRYFNEGAMPEGMDIDDTLSMVCKDYMKDIVKFVSETDEDIWAIYFTKLIGSNIFIVKTVDWRVYKWTSEQYDKQNPDNTFE